MRKRVGWMPILFYFLAVLMGIYMLYALFNSVSYIQGMISAGYVSVSDSFSDIIAYFITGVGTYLFYTAVFAFMGYVVDVLQRGIKPKKEVESEPKDEASIEAVEEKTAVEPMTAAADKKVIRYCKHCYTVIDPENVPDVCPECGEPLA